MKQFSERDLEKAHEYATNAMKGERINSAEPASRYALYMTYYNEYLTTIGHYPRGIDNVQN